METVSLEKVYFSQKVVKVSTLPHVSSCSGCPLEVRGILKEKQFYSAFTQLQDSVQMDPRFIFLQVLPEFSPTNDSCGIHRHSHRPFGSLAWQPTAGSLSRAHSLSWCLVTHVPYEEVLGDRCHMRSMHGEKEALVAALKGLL